MKVYFTVPKTQFNSILAHGILVGLNDGQIENLPFLIVELEEPYVGVGHAAYFAFEADEKHLRKVNHRKGEYYADVPTDRLIEFCLPPTENWEVIEMFKACNLNLHHPDYQALWQFQPVEMILAEE